MSDLTSLARWIILAGLLLSVLGGLLWILGRSGLPLGRLPGDFRFETGNITCFIPIATSIVLSLVLTLIINLLARWLK
jgi:hypothetical protein